SRQYRRLALILHPDKNRHPDAEAAFKKLTAAFEKLHDPAQQALCRAEAEQRNRGRPRKHRGDSSSGGRPSESRHEYGGGGTSSARSGVNRPAEAPRWCREGEYVPEAEQKREEGPDTEEKTRPMDEFLEEFEQREKAFKEEVARAKEANAERKRVRAEARSVQEQERMSRLRDDVLGSDGSEVEAKTASWLKFNSTTTPKRRGGGGTAGRREKAKRNNSKGVSSPVVACSQGQAYGAEGSGSGVEGSGGDVGDLKRGGGADAAAGRSDGSSVAGEKAAGSGFACWVCRRGFKSAKGLAHHEAKSELHEINVQLREFLTP
ncbi:unnamed protein product, partial [Ectocarpus sp. 8 AP-2014]